MSDDKRGKPVGPDEEATRQLEALQCDLWAAALEKMDNGPRESLGRSRASDCVNQYFEIIRDFAFALIDDLAGRWLASDRLPLAGLNATRSYAEGGLIDFVLAEYDAQSSEFHADSEVAKAQILTRLKQVILKRLARWKAKFLRAYARNLKGSVNGSGNRSPMAAPSTPLPNPGCAEEAGAANPLPSEPRRHTAAIPKAVADLTGRQQTERPDAAGIGSQTPVGERRQLLVCYRRQFGRTVKQICEEARVDPSDLYKWVRGDLHPPNSTKGFRIDAVLRAAAVPV